MKNIAIILVLISLPGCSIEPTYRIPHHLSSQLIIGSKNLFPDVDISDCGELPHGIGPMDHKKFHGFDRIGPEVVKCIVKKRTEKVQCKPEFSEFLRSYGVICVGYRCGGNAIAYDPKEKQIAWIVSFYLKLDPELCISRLDANFTYMPKGSY